MSSFADMSTEDLLALDDDGIEALMNQELSATLDAPDDFEEHARLGALDHGAYTAAVIGGAAGMTISVEPEVFQDYSLAEQREKQGYWVHRRHRCPTLLGIFCP